jgi:hypothetical protein
VADRSVKNNSPKLVDFKEGSGEAFAFFMRIDEIGVIFVF